MEWMFNHIPAQNYISYWVSKVGLFNMMKNIIIKIHKSENTV